MLAPPEPSPNERLCIRLTEDQKTRLKSASQLTGGHSVSRIIRALIDQHLEGLVSASR